MGMTQRRAKKAYEDGMATAFSSSAANALRPDGRLVIVFANKQPDAWETLVSAIIRAGFVVDGSWPIQTEQATRMRALILGGACLLRLACLQEASCDGPAGMGQQRPGGDADKYCA